MFEYHSTFILCITIYLIVHTTDCIAEEPVLPFGCDNIEDAIIEEWRLCDGVEDCDNGNDEEPFMCQSYTCHPYMPFKCPDNGRCLRNFTICDGAPHCLDFSDEAPEMCKTWQCDPAVPFKCKSDGMCLRATAVCDGAQNCLDRSDEDPEMCKTWSCHPDVPFKCEKDGKCLQNDALCDGYQNCTDRSDENTEMCKKWTCPEDRPYKCNNIGGICVTHMQLCNVMGHKKRNSKATRRREEVTESYHQVLAVEHESFSSETVIQTSQLGNSIGYQPQEDILYKIDSTPAAAVL